MNDNFSNNERDSNGQKFGPVPVTEGVEYDVDILSIGDKGDGIAKIGGFVIVVANTQKGERVRIRVNAVRGRVSFGEVIERLPSLENKLDNNSIDDEINKVIEKKKTKIKSKKISN